MDDGRHKLLIIDSANSHLKPQVIEKLRKKKVFVSVIPKGCTQYLQVLDTSVFSTFKNHYQAAADEYIDHYGSRSKIKLSAKEQRILCTRLVSTAWIRTQKSIDFERAFFDIGYTWVDQSPVSLRTLPGFVFDPSTITDEIISDDDNETNNTDAEDKEEFNKTTVNGKKNSHICSINNSNKMKQLNLYQFMKK